MKSVFFKFQQTLGPKDTGGVPGTTVGQVALWYPESLEGWCFLD